MSLRPCQQCGTQFEAATPRGRLCSSKCRKAASRGTPPEGSVAAFAPSPGGSGTAAAVRAELEAADRAGTYLGASALALAERIDSSTAVMGFAALVKELRSTMSAAMAGVKVAADPVDEMKARRDRKLAAG